MLLCSCAVVVQVTPVVTGGNSGLIYGLMGQKFSSVGRVSAPILTQKLQNFDPAGLLLFLL